MHPAVCLLADIAEAAGATPVETQGKVFAAAFAGLAEAIRAARRLQWALQGFVQGESAANLAMAVLVGNSEEFPGFLEQGRLPAALAKAAPGGILLTVQAAQAAEEQVAYALTGASEPGFQSLLWRAPEEQSNAPWDETVLSALIDRKGPEFSADFRRQDAATAEQVQAEQMQMGSEPSTIPQLEPLLAPRSALPTAWNAPGRLSWIVGGAAVLLVALVLILMPHHPRRIVLEEPQAGSSLPTASPANPPIIQPEPQPAPQSASPQAAQPQPPPAAPQSSKAKAQQAKAAPAAKPAPPAKPTAQPRGNCDLEQSQIGGQIELAEKNLGRGKYKDAQRQFESVLACDPGSGRAREGLARVRQAQMAEGR